MHKGVTCSSVYHCMFLNLSHFSAHVVNHLLSENRKTILKILSGKKLLKNVTLQIFLFFIFIFYNKLTDKRFPQLCNVKFPLLVCGVLWIETVTNLTLHHMGKIVLSNLSRKNLKSGGLHF